MDSAGERFAAIQEALADRKNILTVKELCELAGVSRSGSTIVGALFAGLDRKAAADFSFLLSIPSIVGGAVLEIPDALREGFGNIDWLCVAAGMLVAGVTGYFAIRLMLTAIKKRSLWGFAVYTGLLGAAILVDQFFTHRFF